MEDATGAGARGPRLLPRAALPQSPALERGPAIDAANAASASRAENATASRSDVPGVRTQRSDARSHSALGRAHALG